MEDPNKHAAIAAQLATNSVTIALISALKSSGTLDSEVFKEHLTRIEKRLEGVEKLNESEYQKVLNTYIAAAEGRL